MGIFEKLIRVVLGPPPGGICKICKRRAVAGVLCSKCGFLCKECVLRIMEKSKINKSKFSCPKCGDSEAERLKG